MLKGIFYKYGTIIAGVLLCALLGTVMIHDYYDQGVIKYSVSPEITKDSEGMETIGLKVMDIRMNDETLAGGYIGIKFNEERAEEGYKYIVWVYCPSNENYGYQFTLNNFEEWTMMPLPYEDQYLVIFRQSNEDYDKSFTLSETMRNDLGFDYMEKAYTVPTETVCCYRISGVGNYLENPDCFLNKTVWVNWEDNSEMVMIADRLMELSDYDPIKYEVFVMEWIHDYIRYEEEKKDNRPQDKYYGLLVEDDTVIESKGLCSDMSGLFCVMMRSQGIPCRYIEGLATDLNGVKDVHAWNQTIHGNLMNAYDVTNGCSFIGQDYEVGHIK